MFDWLKIFSDFDIWELVEGIESRVKKKLLFGCRFVRMLEKIGLPPKPSMRGGNWVVDASHCQGCASQFTFINRKVHLCDPLLIFIFVFVLWSYKVAEC